MRFQSSKPLNSRIIFSHNVVLLDNQNQFILSLNSLLKPYIGTYSSFAAIDYLKVLLEITSIYQIFQQFVCFKLIFNPELLQELKEYLEELKNPKPYLPFETNENCNICFESTKMMVKTIPCNHIYCKHCINKWLTKNPSCPLCHTQLF